MIVVAKTASILVCMAETLRFGFEKTRMCLDVPQDIMDNAVDSGCYTKQVLTFAQPEDRVVTSRPIEGGRRLTFSTQKTGRLPDRLKRDRCKQMVVVVDEVTQAAPDDRQDPSLSVEMGVDYINNGDRLGFNARVRWPDADPIDVQIAATRAMCRTAKSLRYMADVCPVEDLVYAQVDRERGVTLETNPMASASLDTDGDSYNLDDPVIDLSAHNMYSHEMQLICLSGLIAIARS